MCTEHFSVLWKKGLDDRQLSEVLWMKELLSGPRGGVSACCEQRSKWPGTSGKGR